MVERFAFGQPVLSRPPSAVGRRSVYVLGAYPSGLHVKWTPPSLPGQTLRPIRAMIVDNEPTPFWDGADAEQVFDEWKSAVGWVDAWGTVGVAPEGLNGPSGRWVDQHILGPLGVGRDETSLSDCLDRARLNDGQAARIADTYQPLAEALGLPNCTLRPVPAGEDGIVAEASDQLDRLRAEILACAPEQVVTLGNAALRVARQLFDSVPSSVKALRKDGYGAPIDAELQGRRLTWLPLVHPRSGARTASWPAIHDAWEGGR